MNQFFLKELFAVPLLFMLCACGGGGGGGGSGGGSGSASTGVRILHAAIELAPVDVVSSIATDKVVQRTSFSESKGYSALSAGAQEISIRIAGRLQDQLSLFSLDVQKGNRFSALVFGAAGAQSPARVALFADSRPELSAGQAAVRIVNGLAGSSGLNALVGQAAEIRATPFGSASEYLPVTAGVVSAVISSGGKIFDAPLTLDSRRSYSLFVGGEEGYFSFVRFLEDG